MADKALSDQLALRTVDQLRELDWAEPESIEPMLTALEDSPLGSEVLLPVYEEDGETVTRIPYVHDGDGLLHRADTKPAEVLMRQAEREAAARG